MSQYMYQEKNDTLEAGFFQKNVFKKKSVQIKVLETAIAGMSFHIEGEQDEQNLDELVPGTELKLYRDVDNEFDEWAIGVYYGDDDLLGYITRYKNETIARLMDCGKKFIAIVDEPREDSDDKRHRHAPTERGVPVSVYLVEE